ELYGARQFAGTQQCAERGTHPAERGAEIDDGIALDDTEARVVADRKTDEAHVPATSPRARARRLASRRARPWPAPSAGDSRCPRAGRASSSCISSESDSCRRTR